VQSNPAAYASIRSENQRAFASVPEVQTVQITTAVVREQHTLELDNAKSGEFVLLGAGQTVVPLSAYRLTPQSTPNDIRNAVLGISTCASISVSVQQLNNVGGVVNSTGTLWTITYSCPTSTGWPLEQPVSLSLAPQPGKQWAMQMNRTVAASRPASGSFALTWNNATTSLLSYAASASQIQSALQALPGIQSVSVRLLARLSTWPCESAFYVLSGYWILY
jgi:hypothetical protein